MNYQIILWTQAPGAQPWYGFAEQDYANHPSIDGWPVYAEPVSE